MEDKDKILDEIFNNDPYGLLNVKPKASHVRTADERLSASFEEINDFVSKNNREPAPNPANIQEFQLYSRLKGFREDESKIIALKPLDRFGLLQFEKKEINSIDDIFNDDTMGIFDDGEVGSLFEFRHTPREFARAEADFIARRKPCKDFSHYEQSFKQVQKELQSGKRKLIPFSYELLSVNNYYVHKGLLLFLKSVKWERTVQKFESGMLNRPDGRTLVIFENGTQTNMMFQSLYKALHLNGKAVTKSSDEQLTEFNENFSGITEEDKEAGFIYVASSKSTDPKISAIQNLYKVGYSSTPVELRVKNAINEPTYLMAPISIEAEYKTFNMNTQKFEQLIHNFFGNSCLDIDVFDNRGQRHRPQEWFIAPLRVIDQAIELIITGEVIKYQYDKELQVITLKEGSL